MNKWFTGITTIEELRKRYRKLLKEHHPDTKNGNVEITQEINNEYDQYFKHLQNHKTSGNSENKTSYTDEENEHFKVILNQIIGFDMTIEIIGSWLWCFDCYSYKDKLKALGFKWCSCKKAWTWHDGEYHRHHNKEVSLSQIRTKYGSQTVSRKSKQHSLD